MKTEPGADKTVTSINQETNEPPQKKAKMDTMEYDEWLDDVIYTCGFYI